MKWQGRPQSTNVEDRRGQPSPLKTMRGADYFYQGLDYWDRKQAKRAKAPAPKVTQAAEKRNADAISAIARKYENGPF